MSGDRSGALEAITPAFREAGSTTEMFARFVAECYALAGEVDAGIDSLENAVRLGSATIRSFRASTRSWRTCAATPRFDRLMKIVEREWREFRPGRSRS